MRYLLKQKLLSWGDDFVIRDGQDRQVYYVDGKAFSIGDKLSFQDNAGNELAFIRQKLIALAATYEIYRAGQLAAVVKKKLFTFLHCRFTVDVPGPDDLEAKGSFLEFEYEFSRHGRRVAEVSKKFFRLSDTYGVEIAEGEDDVLILASAVVIDMVCHDNKQNH
ncbi:MAG: LURP-one-related family protein [Verrucomicrobiota bacterium]